MVNIDNKIEDLKRYFKSNKYILSVWIIGSYGTEFQREDSDIDFAVLFDGKVSFMEEMNVSSEISSLIKYEDVDLVNLQNAPITLQFKTIKEGIQIYEGNFIKTSDFIELVLNKYRDAKYYIESYNRDFLYSFKERK